MTLCRILSLIPYGTKFSSSVVYDFRFFKEEHKCCLYSLYNMLRNNFSHLNGAPFIVELNHILSHEQSYMKQQLFKECLF